MNGLKYTLIGIGVLSIVLFLVLLVIGIKVVSTAFVYIIGTIAIIALIGFAVYYLRKLFK